MERKRNILAAVGVVTALACFPHGAGAGANPILNHSFEKPQIGTGNFHHYYKTRSHWSYSGSTFLINAADPASGGSEWWPSAPCPTGYEGTQFAGVQMVGSLSQTFTISTSGDYLLRWLAAGRPISYGGAHNGDETYEIEIDGLVVGKPYSTSSGEPFTPQHLTLSGLSAGVHTLTFHGLVTASDETAFIDDVEVHSIAAM